MKKIFTFTVLIAISILFTVGATAQNTSPYWSLAGNNNATSTSKIGTTNNQDLRIVTNNVTRLFLNTNGNIGLNTTAPRAPIHVNGTSKDTGIYSIAIQYGVVGVNTSTSNPYYAGVFGKGPTNGMYAEGGDVGVYAEGGINSGTGIGVFGLSQYGAGVQGQSDGTGVKGVGIYSGVSGFGQSYGVYGEANPGAAGGGWGVYGKGVYGVYGISLYDTGRGVYGKGVYGVYGDGTTYGMYATGRTGVYATTATSFNDAVRADAQGPSASWGVYATSLSSFGIYASSLAPGSYAAYFAGNVYSTGSFVSSDEKLKKNIQPAENGLGIINRLAPKNYEYRHDGDYAKMNLPAGNQYGLIAQEVEQVLPALVRGTSFPIGKIKADEKYKGNYPKGFDEKTLEESIDFKAVNYTGLIPILIKATQELNEKVEILQSENTAIREELAKLKNNGNKNETSSSLLQNVPNPVAGNTTIGYSLPSSYSKAQITVADSKGSIIKQVNVAGAGKGIMQLNVAGFSSGIYTYALLIDGKAVASKQMIIAQ